MYAYVRSQEGLGVQWDKTAGLFLHPAIGESVYEHAEIQGHFINFRDSEPDGNDSSHTVGTAGHSQQPGLYLIDARLMRAIWNQPDGSIQMRLKGAPGAAMGSSMALPVGADVPTTSYSPTRPPGFIRPPRICLLRQAHRHHARRRPIRGAGGRPVAELVSRWHLRRSIDPALTNERADL
jgi:hypothetical protein